MRTVLFGLLILSCTGCTTTTLLVNPQADESARSQVKSGNVVKLAHHDGNNVERGLAVDPVNKVRLLDDNGPTKMINFKSKVRQNILFELDRTNFKPSYRLNDLITSTDNNSQTSIWEEMGYILAMETVFTGSSYLASRKNGYAPAIAGGFDVFIGLAGLKNASKQKSGIKKTGHYLISAGFIAKSLYTFRFGKNHSSNARFLTNFIGFNVLVFTGYFLDTLK